MSFGTKSSFLLAANINQINSSLAYCAKKCIQKRSHVAIYSFSHQMPSSSFCIMPCSWAASFLQPAVATHQTYPNSISLSGTNTKWMLSGCCQQCQLPLYLWKHFFSTMFSSNTFPSRSRNALCLGHRSIYHFKSCPEREMIALSWKNIQHVIFSLLFCLSTSASVSISSFPCIFLS